MTESQNLTIGALLFPGLDQMDFTGPFEVLSQLPRSRFLSLWKDLAPVRDMNGLLLTPDTTFVEAPPIDVLVVPGGFGVEELMTDAVVIDFVRTRAKEASLVFSICTGSLLLGATGFLRGRPATTHWTVVEALRALGANFVDQRVVVSEGLVCAAGATSGIDGALTVAALLRGDAVAQQIQLGIQYAPSPPFQSGEPATAPPDVVAAVKEGSRPHTERAIQVAQAVARSFPTDLTT